MMIKRNLMALMLCMVVVMTCCSIGFASTIQLPQTGQTKCYNSAGTVIPCAGTGQDGEILAGAALPNPRFSFDEDCVVDNLTGLMWSRNADLPNSEHTYLMTWQQALDYVASLNNGAGLCGYHNWHLPNRKEFLSLIDYSRSALPAEHPFTNVSCDGYWLSTTDANASYLAYIGGICSGGIFYDWKTDFYFVWPVRTGQLGGAVSLPKTGQTKCYDAYGNEITCTNTGQDGDIQAGAAWPDPRFTVSADCVTDNLTGLIWAKNGNLPNETKTWQEALDYAASLNNGAGLCGYHNWHLPNMIELESLLNAGVKNSYLWNWLNEQGFTNVQSAIYWSSTTDVRSGITNYNAWTIDMIDGEVNIANKESAKLVVFPVNGGQVSPPTTNLLTIASANPSSGVSISVSPNDNSAQGDGTTQFTRTYNNGTSVTLTAPSTAGGNTFSSWSGCDSASENICTVVMSSAKNVTATFNTGTLTDGLVAYYPFNGNANDESGNGHDGTVTGATLTTDRKNTANSAYLFDGVNDYIELGTWFNYQTFTISMWVKPGSSQLQYADIIDNNHTNTRSWVLQQNSTTANNYHFGVAGDAPNEHNINFTLNANEWTHIAITRDGVTRVMTVYLNGSPLPSVTGTADIPYDGTQFLRLSRWGGGGRYWNGLMDEVRIYNRALSAAEIGDLYNPDPPQQYTLTVSNSGTGSGTVTADSGTLIWVGNTGTASYNAGTTVELTASASNGSTFTSWSGCDSTNGNQCSVTINAAKSVIATFDENIPNQYQLSITKTGTGNGTITSSPKGINCGFDCDETFPESTKPKRVTLKVKPDENSTFLGWGGDCQVSGTKTSCKLTMNSDKNVSASFGLPDISVLPDSYDFGDVTVKQSSSPATFTIQNNGTGDLQKTKMKIIGTDAKMFKIKGSCSKTIASGGICEFTVTFNPKSTGSKSATLQITSNDPDTATIGIPLMGGIIAGHIISGRVTSNGTGLSGVSMSLSGSAVSSTSTDSDGNYTFTGLQNGSYTITPSKAGYTINPASLTVTLDGANMTSQNFIATALGVVCGQTITENVILDKDLECPPDTESAIIIGASNIMLDLGGHVLRGHAPGTGIFAQEKEGIIIRNGTIEGFNDGIFIINTHYITIENLTVKNQNIVDPNHFIFGVHIDNSQDVVVRDMLFEFPSVAHKSAVEIYESDVAVSNIDVRGGGVGVSFSFNQVCDPTNSPSNGTVLNSRFSGIYVGGIWIACSSNVQIAGNDISTAPGVGVGIQGDAPFFGAVTGLTVEGNNIHAAVIGIEFRGIINSTISDNIISNNSAWGIAMRPSLGCLAPEPGWDCFYSTTNVITNNETSGNATDLFQDEACGGNTWVGNTCETKQGNDIPECTP
jgi:parallel beta-helix repeat protein